MSTNPAFSSSPAPTASTGPGQPALAAPQDTPDPAALADEQLERVNGGEGTWGDFVDDFCDWVRGKAVPTVGQ